ncbi:hypothetical protein C1H46_037439 [Malus baccata]|uniref:Uncharacterized protein n=1 Tax=Malus baccata TaxID=106549 RepID=A0A540KRZ0_MALBA|nr:hypothetical protein C1H46_037439 [Malus baccata]
MAKTQVARPLHSEWWLSIRRRARWPIGIVWYADGTGRNGEEAKMPLDGNKEEEGDGYVIILCSTDVERVVLGGEAEQKFIKNSSRETARSTRFRRTKRETERLVPLRPSRLTYQTVP